MRMAYLRKNPLAIILVVLFLPALVAHADPLIPLVGGCQILPPDNPWNADISAAAVHPNSVNYINNIYANDGGDHNLHPDFGETAEYGIPYVTVSGTQQKVPVTFYYDEDSDVGKYPIPPNAPIEGGAGSDGDRHVLVIDTTDCMLYETYDSHYVGGAQHAWSAGSGAIFDLRSNALRHDGYTSADAAGLPILPGLARCDEAMSPGGIKHALRFTVDESRGSYIYPATHEASDNMGANFPPMGLRLRLQAGYSLAGFTGQALAIATALKKYGMILADNGSSWYISGEADRNNCWVDDDLNQLKDIPGNAFEVIVSPPPAPVTPLAPTLHSPGNGAAITGTQPVLDWNVVTGATKYEVQFGTSPSPTTTVATVFSTSYTQYIPPNPLTSGFTYYWRVRAFDESNNPMPYSAVRSVAIASLPAAGSARNIYTDTTPTLTWTPITWATGYVVEVSETAAFSSPITSGPLSPDVLSWPVSQALDDGTYYWHVRAMGSTTWSPTETIIVHAP
jgi:hypothetical protein